MASLLNNTVYAVGMMTIASFAFDRYPRASKVTFIVGGSILGCAFCWLFAVKPFLEGLRQDEPR